MKFFLVRHGETEWNKSGRFQGQNDVGLNQRGLAQARETALASVAWNPTALYSSPLPRTMQTAGEFAKQLHLPVTPEPALKELDLGQLDGVTGPEMRANWPEVAETWGRNPESVVMPGGESLVQLQDRVWRTVTRLRESHQEEEVLVLISHNFAIRSIFNKLLGMPWSHFHTLYLSLSSVCIMETNPRWGWRLLSYNATGHLSPENLSH
ncbi:MAG: histidine phosphatase family protein [Dehalococcoidia bacterium]